MKATIKTFESGTGDCIFLILKKDEDNSSYHLMVDCNMLSDDIIKFISIDLNKRIDSIVITHVDSDHINGLTALLRRNDMADLHIGNIYFNCFQPKKDKLDIPPKEIKDHLDALPSLLPPAVDENFNKCSGVDAASFICQLNKRPELKAAWRKDPILSGTEINLGVDWGCLKFLSPTQESLDEWYRCLKIEFAKRTGVPPLDYEFENQDMYFELMSRVQSLRKTYSKIETKTAAVKISNDTLKQYAAIDAYENGITAANKASLAFVWEGNGKRVLFLGDSISSTVVRMLNSLFDKEVYFEAIKISHHGSKYSTSADFVKKVNTCHLFLTGGKKGEGPSIETISKYVLKETCPPENKHTLHYNHLVKGELIDQLLEVNNTKVINLHSFYLSNNNEHTFEY